MLLKWGEQQEHKNVFFNNYSRYIFEIYTQCLYKCNPHTELRQIVLINIFLENIKKRFLEIIFKVTYRTQTFFIMTLSKCYINNPSLVNLLYI